MGITSSNWEEQVALFNTSDFCSVRHCWALLPGALWATTPSCVSNCTQVSARVVLCEVKSHTAGPCPWEQVTVEIQALTHSRPTCCTTQDELCKEGKLELLMASSGALSALLPQFLGYWAAFQISPDCCLWCLLCRYDLQIESLTYAQALHNFIFKA